MGRKRIIEIFFIILAVFTITIGFSAYGNQASIAGAVADVMLQDDLRITNVNYNTATNSGSSNYAEHGKFTMITSVNLPNASSTVTYNVELTNFGNVTKGIYAITNLPSNLTYTISGYNMRDDVCDSSGKCTLGAKKEFTITIKYATNGFTSSKTRYDLNVIFDFRAFHTLTWTKYNLFYHLGDKGTTNAGRMNYSISNDVVTVTATADDGYGFIPYKVDLEAGKTYVFNATSSGTYGSGSGSDTVEGYLMKDCAYNYYVHVQMNTPSEIKPTQTGTYCLRLDSNKNGVTHTFRNITIGEVVGSSRVAHNEKLNAVSGTLPSISKSGYTYIGYFDSSYRDSPFNFYADAYGDLYNAFGYNQESLWNHYKNQGGPIEGRQVSQYIGNTVYTGGKSQYIYGYLKPTTTYTISYDANGGSGAPSAQSKLIDRDLQLTTTQPTRTGYIFMGWNTAADGSGTNYSPGQIYTANSNVTLYAKWLQTVTITYYKTADINWAAATIYTDLRSHTGPVSGSPNYLHCSVSPPSGTTVSSSSLDFNNTFSSESNRDMQSFTIPLIGTTVRWQNPNKNVQATGATKTLTVPVGTILTFTINNSENHGQTGAIYTANSTDAAYRVWGPGESKNIGTYAYTVTRNITVRANWKTSGEYVPGLTEFIKYIGVGSSTDDRNSWWDVHIF